MSSQYYLGIAGEQTGPFTEQELRAKIKASEVPEDALVWHDAMDNWKPVRQVPELWAHFKGPASSSGPPSPPPKPKAKAPAKKSIALEGEFDAIATFATSDASLEPAFRNDGKPTKKKKSQTARISLGSNTKKVALFVALTFVLALAGFFFVSGGEFGGTGEPTADAPVGKETGSGWGLGALARQVGLGTVADMLGLGGAPEPVATPVPNPADQRRKALKKAQDDIMVNPEAALVELRKIIQQKNDDEVAKSATDSAVNYLQSVRRANEAGKLLLETKRPAEAVTMFLEPPENIEEADKAMLAAADAAKGEDRRKWIVKSLDLLLDHKMDGKVVEDRVRLMEKEFPSTDHPYRYYLKSDDEKIADIFNRISFAFVQKLLAFIATEFPQLTLQGRPTVAVVREAPDKYRLVGRYNGDVQLSRDVLPKVKFVFWEYDDLWHLVETDVTDDRRRFAAIERKRRQDNTYTAKAMLTYLERIFRQRYPGAALHLTQEAAEKHREKASD